MGRERSAGKNSALGARRRVAAVVGRSQGAGTKVGGSSQPGSGIHHGYQSQTASMGMLIARVGESASGRAAP